MYLKFNEINPGDIFARDMHSTLIGKWPASRFRIFVLNKDETRGTITFFDGLHCPLLLGERYSPIRVFFDAGDPRSPFAYIFREEKRLYNSKTGKWDIHGGVE